MSLLLAFSEIYGQKKKLFSVQYHPEANPGPQDSKYLFEKFLKNIKETKKNGKKKRY